MEPVIDKAPSGSNTDVESMASSTEGLKRDLASRHINMIALAGMIGTGLFLSSGQSLARAGPVGILLGYIIMGIVAAGISFTTGELTSFHTQTGGFIRHATRYVEPALGAATGWNFWYTIAIAVPAELSAAATLVQYWNDTINPGVWLTIFLIFIVTLNFCGVRLYGESEVFFASLKIMLIIGLIIGGLVIDLGGAPNHERLGFHYWRDPGPFNAYVKTGDTGHFLAWWKIMISAAYSYGNIQIVAISGSETQNPRHTIASATKKIFWRILIFYVITIFIVTLIVPYDDPSLSISTGTAAQSPFVIAFKRAGVSAVPSIINAVVMTSAISGSSACIYIASRTLFGLSRDSHAPKIFQVCNRRGVPYYAVGFTCLLLPLVYMSVNTDSSVVFSWFVNITTLAGMVGWLVIEVTYLRFLRALKAQGYTRDDIYYKGPLQPYLSYFTILIIFLVVLFSGWDIFLNGQFTASGFLTNYLNIFIFIALYGFFKIYLKSKLIPLHDIDLKTDMDAVRGDKMMEQGFVKLPVGFVGKSRLWLRENIF